MLAIGIMAVQFGCTAQRAEKTGFLSDYSKLEAQSDVSARYRAPGNPLASYSKFIIDPVVTHFHTGSKAAEKLKEEDLRDLKNYMHDALVEAIEDRYEIVYQPGPRVARLRSALTDLKKSGIVQNIIPVGKAIGSGLGGASLEAELLDSKTGEQIGALVESQLGSRIPFAGLDKWDAAKQAMDEWGKRLQKRLEEVR